MSEHAFLILSAGQVSNELSPIFGDIPSGLIPIRGKPALMHNLKTILSETHSDVYVVLGHKKELIERRVFHYLSEDERRRLHEVVSDPARRPGYSFRLAVERARLDGARNVTVVLGDTLLTPGMLKTIRAGGAFLAVSRDYTNPSRWALVESQSPLRILNKPPNLETSDYPAIIGVYHLEGIDTVDLPLEDTEISDCLTAYAATRPLPVVEVHDWIDIGHIDNYYTARKKFIVTRHFNRIEVDEFANLLTKRSDDRAKLTAEIDWYEGLPAELRWVYPAVFSADRQAPSVTMEYLPYPSLDELFLYSDLHESTWSVILAKLTRLLRLFNDYRADVDLEQYRDMYVVKVRSRIEELKRQGGPFESLASASSVTVNGGACLSVDRAVQALEAALPRLYAQQDHCVVHGDFCFPNILYSPESGAVKLVDPRGSWGKPGISGDIKYDYAKLMHSISGGYDSIINDYVDVRANGHSIDVNVFRPRVAGFLEKTLRASMPHRAEAIELIEGGIFVSIAAIHREDPRRQLAMLAVGLEKITRNAERV